MMMPSGRSTRPYTRTMCGELTPIMIIASFCSAALALASTLFSCFTATSKPCHFARYTVPNVPLPILPPMDSAPAPLIWGAGREASLSNLRAAPGAADPAPRLATPAAPTQLLC